MEYYDYINIDKSMPDSRSLIMPHQSEAVNTMTEYFQTEKDISNRNGMLVMPTGSGKTYTAVTWLLQNGIANGYRVVWLVHRQELVEQTYQEFIKQAPQLKNTEIHRLRVLPVSGVHLHMSVANKADIYVCSIQSVANQNGYRFIERMLGAAGKRKLIVVIDEAHHAVSASYQKVLKRITQLNHNRILLGLTATPLRMNDSEQKKLHSIFNIEQNIQHHIGINGYVYRVTLKQLLMSGFLAEPKYKKISTEINGEIEYDLTDEDKDFFARFGELSQRLKNQIAKSSARNEIIVNQYINNKDKYGKTLIFAVNQLHAETLCNSFLARGIKCDYAVSSRADVPEVTQKFKNNELDVLINVQILTEGSDIPDIHTVFLTRETNSDSLLMQMIGRGLRGEKAGGTKDAYIVDFHDTWDSFAAFLEPKKILTDELERPEEVEDALTETPAIEKANNEQEGNIVPPIKPVDDSLSAISMHDIYMKLFGSIRASLISKNDYVTFPIGWYSVTNENGEDVNLLVFDCQQKSYHEVSMNIAFVRNISSELLLSAYFNGVSIQPDLQEMDYFLDYINNAGELPPFYTFEQRENCDPQTIAKILLDKFGNNATEKQGLEYLQTLYEQNQILSKIYKYFFAFRKTVFDCLKDKKDSIIEVEDVREYYSIIDNYFDLSELLQEVLAMFPGLSAEGLVKLNWSDNVVRNWFAVVFKFDESETHYQIYVNRLLSSPKVNREVIKYLLFHELLHQNGYWQHDREFRLREWQYPNSAELDGFLDSLALEYNMTDVLKKSKATETHSDESNPHNNSVPSEPIFNSDADGVEQGFQYCMNCGFKLPSTAKFCKKCGTACQ